jgi:hypothetical protein
MSFNKRLQAHTGSREEVLFGFENETHDGFKSEVFRLPEPPQVGQGFSFDDIPHLAAQRHMLSYGKERRFAKVEATGEIQHNDGFGSVTNQIRMIKELTYDELLQESGDRTLTSVFGHVYHFKDGKLHRENDEPAICFTNGDKHWYKEGKLHRDNDLPAVMNRHGDEQIWYQHGQLHRDNDRYAWKNGTSVYWAKEGKFVRDGGMPVFLHNYITIKKSVI